ncbi:DUF6970 domain-containing protein [Bernardetia sp.]|uniref:DUF6970 domain-containing protein n=1 Tax=Bernardetia sp. TaxID=1937974 RepID=UPI0025BC5E9D|nr:hypothetical protein [Bernardetia sp.]
MEGNIMECEEVIEFIEDMRSDPVPAEEEDRATIEKYTFDGKVAYLLVIPPTYFTDALPSVIDSNCNTFCMYSHVDAEDTCDDYQEVKFIEVVWRHDE